jgi:hypothetical protein
MNSNFFLKWVATAVTLLFAVLTSLQITPINIWVANVSSVMWLVWAVRIREWSLVVVNFGLLAVYFAGLFVGA